MGNIEKIIMLYFIFTIDGDWDEYFDTKLPEEKRQADDKVLAELIKREIKLARSVIDGKMLHFVHSSPLARDYFVKPVFVSLWKEIEQAGGSVGVHCHEEELYKSWHFDDTDKMKLAINFLSNGLRKNGLSPISYRGGFMTFSPKIIPFLEENNLVFDFSCEPGRHLVYNNVLVSDWQGAPANYYRLSYEDHRRPGNSQVVEIPLGIYIERLSLWQIWQKARELKKRQETQILSVMAHTYDYTSFKMRLKIKLALLILKRYGTFVSDKEALRIMKGESR